MKKQKSMLAAAVAGLFAAGAVAQITTAKADESAGAQGSQGSSQGSKDEPAMHGCGGPNGCHASMKKAAKKTDNKKSGAKKTAKSEKKAKKEGADSDAQDQTQPKAE